VSIQLLVPLTAFDEAVVGSGAEESQQQNHEGDVGGSLYFLGAVNGGLFVLELLESNEGLGLVVHERHEEARMDHTDGGDRHGSSHQGVEDVAVKHLFVGLLHSGRVFIGDHLEAGLRVVISVRVEDPVEVRELPREDIARQQECGEVDELADLSVSSDERRESSDDSTDGRVGRASLFHGQVNHQVGKPDCVTNEVGVWVENAVGEQGARC